MPKSILLILAALSLLLAALVLGRQPAPRGSEPHPSATSRGAAHAHVMVHAAWHDGVIIDDDEATDDDDDAEIAMLSPQADEGDDVASDATSDERSASATFTTTGPSLRITGRGIRPAGEHRSTTDRPPRA